MTLRETLESMPCPLSLFDTCLSIGTRDFKFVGILAVSFFLLFGCFSSESKPETSTSSSGRVRLANRGEERRADGLSDGDFSLRLAIVNRVAALWLLCFLFVIGSRG